MSDHDGCCGHEECGGEHDGASYPARLGKEVEPLVMNTYNPVSKQFDQISFKRLWDEGKWIVLFFYPADFTFVCPTELADLARQHEKLKAMNVEVISVSTDKKYSHLAWHDSERLLSEVKFQMAEDPIGGVSSYFGVYDEDEGQAFRGTFIINPDGVLVGSEINFYNVGRNAQELVRKMEANVYLQDHPVEACPANWEQGKATLTPSEELVGKVYEALHKQSDLKKGVIAGNDYKK